MAHQQEPTPIWTPLYRRELEQLLKRQSYERVHVHVHVHVHVLYWLIWLSLLSREELERLLSLIPQERQIELSALLKVMRKDQLIDAVILREPGLQRRWRYYATDMGLYFYLSTVRPTPPLTSARLARSYPVGRADLLARLARPYTHSTLSTFVTRLIAEGEPDYHVLSYQQPWRSTFAYSLTSDAALLIEHAGLTYAFLVQVDTAPYQRTERALEKLLVSLLDLRQSLLLARHDWPGLLIISTHERLSVWARLLLLSGLKRATRPLAGGITTVDALERGVYRPIWRDLAEVSIHTDAPLLPFAELLRKPASRALQEQFSQQQRFYEILLKEAASLPPRTPARLTRYVGTSLQKEAAYLTRQYLEALFAQKRKSHDSMDGTGLLTLALPVFEKVLLTWFAQHPLLDLATLQAVLGPLADSNPDTMLRQSISRLMSSGLLETRLWTRGNTLEERERYLLTSVALKFMALRAGEPMNIFFVPTKYHRSADKQLWRQWGTAGLYTQVGHTHGLYTFMRRLYQVAQARGEVILSWKSAHESVRWYRDTISQQTEQTRPDAEITFRLAAEDSQTTTVLLEYDRGTTAAYEYIRKFSGYLDYHQATGIAEPILVVSTSEKAIARMQVVLANLPGSLQIALLLEDEVLTHGLAFVRRALVD